MIRRTGTAFLSGTLLLAALTALPATLAHALPSESDALLVEVTSMEPLNPIPGGTLSFGGTITNKSGSTAQDVEVALRISTTPLNSRSEVAAVTDLTTTRRGTVVASTLTRVVDTLDPSSATPFLIAAETGSLPLSGPGVYAFFVEVRSSLGTFDTALPVPWIPDPAVLKPSHIVVLSQVRAPVDLTAANQLMSPVLSASMAPGGSLNGIVAGSSAAAIAGTPVSWLIDPAVSLAASDLASGKATFASNVSDPEAARSAMAAWQTSLIEGASAASAQVYLAPYAEVDASGVIAADQADLLAQAIAGATPAAEASLPRMDGLIAALPDGDTTQQAVNSYVGSGVTTALFSQEALPASSSLSYTPSGVARIGSEGGEMTAIIPDDRLSDDLARPSSTPAEQFRWQQGLLADAAMITLELPSTTRTVVMSPREGTVVSADTFAGALSALTQAPYAQLVGLSALLAPDVPTVPRSQNLDVEDTARLPADYLAPIPGIQQRLASFSRVTVDPPAFALDYDAALLRSASGQWRDDLPRGKRLLTTIDSELALEEGKVTTVSTGTVTFSGNSGQLPLTISNGLDQAVEVGVLLQADPSVRLSFTPPGLVIVDAGKRASIEVSVEVFGTGPLPVTVILTDRDGNPFITTGNLVIQARATSMAAAAVAIIGGVAFLGLVLWRFRRKGPGGDDEPA